MRINVYYKDSIKILNLPKEVYGSYSIDYDKEELSIATVESTDDGKWQINTQGNTTIYNGNAFEKNIIITENMYVILKKDEEIIPIYVSSGFDESIGTYKYDDSIDIKIGNTNDCTLVFNCPFIKGMIATINKANGNLILKKAENIRVYINKSIINENIETLHNGDCVEIYGLKIYVLNGTLMINEMNGKVIISPSSNINKVEMNTTSTINDIDIIDKNLYQQEDYFTKSPRLSRQIETKKIQLSQPPQQDGEKELPLLLTLGPMLTMGIMSFSMLFTSLQKIVDGTGDISTTWPSLLSGGAMLLSAILWPLLTKFYNKRLKEKRNKELVFKYSKYLDEKRVELDLERKLQKEILLENLITVEECINNINIGKLNFWNKRIEQRDFLTVRIGTGNAPLDVEIDYPEEGFTIEENELKDMSDKLIEEYKYIEDVPIQYSFYKNKITGVMGEKNKIYGLMNNILIQLISFYSYDDLKFVVLTNNENESKWDYLKYLNHCFDDSKQVRFFSTNYENAKNLCDALNSILQQRIESAQNEKSIQISKPHFLIITDDYSQIKSLDFIKLITEIDASLGFSMIIIEQSLSKLPSKCCNFINLSNTVSGILTNSFEKQEQQIFKDEIKYNIDLKSIVRKVANIPIEFSSAEGGLPESINFLEMEKVGKVEQLNILDRWKTNDSTQSLKAEIGIDSEGNYIYLDLHEKFHGPHGLIAGMTGSGKSEFIITYILSMAMNYSPEDVAFILIDYKGGGLAFAFENKGANLILPHLTGTITNLDKAEMNRTLISIDSEAKRRQKLFNEARDKLGESTIDIYKYQSFYKEGKLDIAIPHLFIVCDEFAELKSQQPEFMDDLISIARIGRSLGVHLILATQKPSGVVTDQIWSNSKFHICLKVQDEGDSKEMLKKPDAANLKQAGRFYLQVGYDEYFALGQSGWCGAKYYPSDLIEKQVDKSINIINETGAHIKNITANIKKKVEPQGEQLAAVMKNIIEISNKMNVKASKLWLDNIPEIISSNYLRKKYNIEKKDSDAEIILGEYDAPENQEQGPLIHNFKEKGNIFIIGNNGEEKEKFVNAIIYQTCTKYKSSEVNLYILDFGSEQTRMFSKFPQIGGQGFITDDETFKNTLKLIKETINTRKKKFIDYGGSLENYNRANTEKLQQMVVIINNIEGVLEIYQNFSDELITIVRDCNRYGIYFVISASSINSLGRRVQLCFPTRYVFRLSDSSDYSFIFDTRVKLRPKECLARGLTIYPNSVHEFQTLTIAEENENEIDKIKLAIEESIRNDEGKTIKVPALPDKVDMTYLEKYPESIKNVPYGVFRNSLETAYLNLKNLSSYTISANKIIHINNFIESFIKILKETKDSHVVFFDTSKLMPNVKDLCENYIDDNFDEVFKKIIEMNDNIKNQFYIYIFYGIEKIKNKLTDSKLLDEFVKSLKKNENGCLIMCDGVKEFKLAEYDNWYMNCKSSTDGLWIGSGFGDQYLLKQGKMTKEMSAKIKNNYGYAVIEGNSELIKLLELTDTKIIEGEENDE